MWSLPCRSGAHGSALQPAQALMLLWCISWGTSLWPLNHLQCSAIPKVLPGLWTLSVLEPHWPPQQQEFLPLGDVSNVCMALLCAQPRPACLEGPWLNSPWVSLSYSPSSEGSSSRHYGQEHQPSLLAVARLQLLASHALQCLFQLSMHVLLYSRSYFIYVKSSFLQTILLMALAPTICLAGGKVHVAWQPASLFSIIWGAQRRRH